MISHPQETSSEVGSRTTRLRAAALPPCAHKFRARPFTQSISGDELRFLALGDWGVESGKTSPRFEHNINVVGFRMGRFAENNPQHLILNVGDSFYEDGINDIRSHRWKVDFEDRFAHPSLQGIYWYSMLGNHDWRGNTINTRMRNAGTMAQIMHTFTNAISNNRWCMPDYNYTTTFEVDGGGDANKAITVDLVVFDSQLIVQYDPRPNTGAFVQSPAIPRRDDMIDWLRRTLCASTADYLITASHHYVVSSGAYYSLPGNPYKLMATRVGPILEECGVSAHFHGHDHVTQVVGLPGGTVQVGVGAGAKVAASRTVPQRIMDEVHRPGKYKALFGVGATAFAAVSVDAQRLKVDIMVSDADDYSENRVAYSTQVPRRPQLARGE